MWKRRFEIELELESVHSCVHSHYNKFTYKTVTSKLPLNKRPSQSRQSLFAYEK